MFLEHDAGNWFDTLPDTRRILAVTQLGDDYTPSEARVNRIFGRLSSRIGAAIMTAADDAVKEATAQLTKAKGEIDAEVSALEQSGVSAEALAGLKSISQSLDDLNADAPVETPAAEPAPVAEPAADQPAAPADEPAPPTADGGDVVASEPPA